MEKSRDEPLTRRNTTTVFTIPEGGNMYTSTTQEVVLRDNQKKVIADSSWAGKRNALPTWHDEDSDNTMTVIKRQASTEAWQHAEALLPTEATKASVARLLGAEKSNLFFTAQFSWIMEPKATWTLEDSELDLKAGYSLVGKSRRTFNGEVVTEEIPSVRVVMNRRAKAKRFVLSFGRKSTRRYGASFNVTRPSDLANYLKK